MGLTIEPQPEMLDPAQWNGLDILSDDDWEQSGHSLVRWGLVEESCTDLAGAVLGECLSYVEQGEYTELPYQAKKLTAESPSVVPGAVFAMESIGVSKFEGEGPLPVTRTEHGAPIDQPFAENWLRYYRSRPEGGFGYESARFPDQRVVFHRSVDWAVAVDSESLGKVLVPIQFSHPRRKRKGLEIHPNQTSLALPVEIGATTRSVAFLGEYSIIKLEKIVTVHRILPARGITGTEATPSLREMIGRLLDSAQRSLPAPTTASVEVP